MSSTRRPGERSDGRRSTWTGQYAVWVSIADRQQALLNSEQYLDRQLERRGATWRDEDVNDLPAVEHWWVTFKAVEASGSV